MAVNPFVLLRKIDDSGRIGLPKEIRERLGVQSGDYILFLEYTKGNIILNSFVTEKEIKEQLLCWLIRFSKIYGVSLALLDKKGNKTIFFGEKDLHQEKCLEQIRKDIEKGIYKQTANMIFPIEKGVCHYGFIVVLYRKEMKFSSETVIAGAKLLSDIIFDIYERRL